MSKTGAAAYCVGTDQNFDRLTIINAIYFRPTLLLLGTAACLWFVGAPWFVWSTVAVVALLMACWRAVHLWPGRQRELKHVYMVYQAAGYWHRAEYVRGRGEMVHVLQHNKQPLPATEDIEWMLGSGQGIDWGAESPDDHPRMGSRIVKTRIAPVRSAGFVFYPRTSAGFVAHKLGIQDPRINTPREVLDYIEHGEAAFARRLSTRLRGMLPVLVWRIVRPLFTSRRQELV